jgi:hypothetical protein
MIQIVQDDGTVVLKPGTVVSAGRRGQLQQRTLDRYAATKGRRNGSPYARKARSGKAVVARDTQRFTSDPQACQPEYQNAFSTR